MKKIFFVLAAVLISNRLLSQDSLSRVSLPEKELDPIVLSASKFPLKTSVTGKVVTIITKEQLERSGGKDLSQILSEQAGIFIAGSGSNPGKEKSLYLRGARIDHTLICVNSIPIYDPSGIGSNFDLRNLSVSNIERIEILKGSQSTLYGSDAIAGVINIITQSISAKKTSGTAGASFGSYGTFRGNGSISGKGEKTDYMVSASLHRTKGIDEAINKNPSVITDNDAFRQHYIDLGFGVKPSQKINLRSLFRFNNIKGDLDQGAFTDELDYTYSQKSWQAGIGGNANMKQVKLFFSYQYNSINRVYTDDSVKSRNGFDIWSEGNYKGAEHFAELYMTAERKKIKLTAGADFRSSRSDQAFSAVGFFGPYRSTYSRDSLHQTQAAIYAAIHVETDKGFNAEAGGRVNFHNEYGSQAVFNFNPSFLVNNKVKIFGNISTGYRTPSLYQLFSEFGNRNLNPEAAFTTEAGVQYFSSTNKFKTRAVVFSRNVKDVIFFYFNNSTFVSQYINQDKQKDHGFEWEATYRPSAKVTLKTFYNFVTGKITTKTGNKDTTYNNLLRRPAHSIGLHIEIQPRENFYFSSNLSINGKRNDSYYDNQAFKVVNTTLKSYVLWDIYGEYSFLKRKFRVFANVENILNSRYTEISGFNTQGINCTGGIRYNF